MPAPTADGPIFDHDHIDQDHAAYRPDDHAVWSTLYRRQREVLAGRDVEVGGSGIALAELLTERPVALLVRLDDADVAAEQQEEHFLLLQVGWTS